jgi:pimeloyl-ACP methyl ester carboxylesterase
VLSIVFLAITFVWWLTLFVTTFVSPVGFYTKGGGWFAFAYSTFTIGLLLILLLFYSTPSKAERIILLCILLFLTANTILILGAYPLRHDELWVGIASVLWALAMTAWAVICDRVVEHGKREEEVRLTGYEQTRYTLAEWLSVFANTISLSIFLIISILFTVHLSIRARDATLAPPGKLYHVDDFNFHVHLNCVGNTTDSRGNKVTTVFLEGGEDPVEGRMENWVKDAHTKDVISRYCYWDRPGMAWSENGPSPLSAGRVASALSTALVKANESGPWVLVSHGVGGIYSRVFASRNTADVHGLLLVDALPESHLHYLGSPLRGFWLWIRGVIYPLGIDRTISAIFLGHSRADRIYGRDAYQNGGQIKAKLQENLVAKSFTKNEIDAARVILPADTPIIVVSSGKAMKKSREWSDGQRELTKLSDNVLAWDVVNGANHNVWENPEGKEMLEKRLGQLVKQK